MKPRVILLIYLILIKFTTLLIAADTCHLHIYLKNKESFQILYIQSGNEYIHEDTLGLDSCIIDYKLSEPKAFFTFINNDADKMIIFYLHKGNPELHIDLANQNYYFKNSALNDEFIRMKRSEDSLREISGAPPAVEYHKLLVTEKNTDSITKLYNYFDSLRSQFKYRYFTKNPNSFLALNFVYISLKGKSIFTRQQIKDIFIKLPKSVKGYPTYKECLSEFRRKKKGKGKTINEPLWKHIGSEN